MALDFKNFPGRRGGSRRSESAPGFKTLLQCTSTAFNYSTTIFGTDDILPKTHDIRSTIITIHARLFTLEPRLLASNSFCAVKINFRTRFPISGCLTMKRLYFLCRSFVTKNGTFLVEETLFNHLLLSSTPLMGFMQNSFYCWHLTLEFSRLNDITVSNQSFFSLPKTVLQEYIGYIQHLIQEKIVKAVKVIFSISDFIFQSYNPSRIV